MLGQTYFLPFVSSQAYDPLMAFLSPLAKPFSVLVVADRGRGDGELFYGFALGALSPGTQLDIGAALVFLTSMFLVFSLAVSFLFVRGPFLCSMLFDFPPFLLPGKFLWPPAVHFVVIFFSPDHSSAL